MPQVSEDTIERAALAWLADIGYEVAYGPGIGPDMPAAERESWDDVVLADRLRDAL